MRNDRQLRSIRKHARRKENDGRKGVWYHDPIEYKVKIESEFEGGVDVCRQIGL